MLRIDPYSSSEFDSAQPFPQRNREITRFDSEDPQGSAAIQPFDYSKKNNKINFKKKKIREGFRRSNSNRFQRNQQGSPETRQRYTLLLSEEETRELEVGLRVRDLWWSRGGGGALWVLPFFVLLM